MGETSLELVYHAVKGTFTRWGNGLFYKKIKKIEECFSFFKKKKIIIWWFYGFKKKKKNINKKKFKFKKNLKF